MKGPASRKHQSRPCETAHDRPYGEGGRTDRSNTGRDKTCSPTLHPPQGVNGRRPEKHPSVERITGMP